MDLRVNLAATKYCALIWATSKPNFQAKPWNTRLFHENNASTLDGLCL